MDRKIIQRIIGLIFIIIIVILNACLALPYSFQRLNEKSLPNELGTFKQLEFISQDRSTTITVNSVELSNQYRAKIYEQKQNNQFYAYYMRQLLQYENFIIAINGSFYSKHFQPIGLFIQENKTLNQWVNSKLLAACIKVNNFGQLSIGFNKKTCIHAWSALQTGPLLIENGQIQTGLYLPKKTSSDFFEENYRTVIALSDKGKVLLLVSSQAKLTDLAIILKDYPSAFSVKNIQTAINLDGGSSTGMYIGFPSSPFYIHEQKPVKTLIMIH